MTRANAPVSAWLRTFIWRRASLGAVLPGNQISELACQRPGYGTLLLAELQACKEEPFSARSQIARTYIYNGESTYEERKFHERKSIRVCW